MSTERNARRASVRVSINGHDATAYIAPSLLDFSYTDNCSGKADEVQLSLQDREARWNGPWKAQKGMQVVARSLRGNTVWNCTMRMLQKAKKPT